MQKKKVVLVDDCEISRLGFDFILKQFYPLLNYVVLTQSDYRNEAEKHNPSILIINSICIPFDTIPSIIRSSKNISVLSSPKLILISNEFHSRYEHDVDGYLSIGSYQKDFANCLKAFEHNVKFTSPTFSKGKNFSSTGMSPSVLYEDYKNLTARESEVLKLIVDGNSTVQISNILFNSTRTIDAHRRNISDKFGLRGQGKLSLFVMQNREILKSIIRNEEKVCCNG